MKKKSGFHTKKIHLQKLTINRTIISLYFILAKTHFPEKLNRKIQHFTFVALAHNKKGFQKKVHTKKTTIFEQAKNSSFSLFYVTLTWFVHFSLILFRKEKTQKNKCFFSFCTTKPSISQTTFLISFSVVNISLSHLYPYQINAPPIKKQ